MTMYNLMFGMNPQSDLLLATIGLKKNDVERFRDVYVSEDGKKITVHSRTGGGNREDYPNLVMRKLHNWQGSHDDDYDSTYCDDIFDVPQEWVGDVIGLVDIFANGLRREFGQHLLKTINRPPTEDDIATQEYEQERQTLAKTKHFMANGHTFVPHDDYAMEAALKIAETNEGKLRTGFGILPIKITVKTDFVQWPNAQDENEKRKLTRIEIGYDYSWAIDEPYWEHCQERFKDKYPVAMAEIAIDVEKYLKKAA